MKLTKLLIIAFVLLITLPVLSYAEEHFPSTQPPASSEDTIVLNFVDANLKDILQTVGDITGANFILAPGVGGRITVQTSRPIPKDDLFGVFESILEANGLSAVKSGAYYKIVPAPEARRKTIDIRKGRDRKALPAGERVITQVVPIEFISAKDLVPILQPMLSKAGTVVNYIKGNTLIITDVSANIKKLFSIIDILDVDVFKEKEIEIFPLTNVDAKSLSTELSDILRTLGLGKDASQLAIVPIERLNSLIVFSSNPRLLASVKEWIERLDRTLSTGSSIYIYYVQNERASNIKEIIDRLFGGKKKAASTKAPVRGKPKTSAPQRGRSPASLPSASTPVQDEIEIYLYEPANALIIQATTPDYIDVMKIIKQLDRQPKQVIIDALIAEVKLDESTQFGIQWSFLEGNVNAQLSSGIIASELVTGSGTVSIAANTAAPGGLSLLVTDAKKFFNIIQALASQGKVNILSNPHIVVRNYEKASINIGSDEPIATKSTQTTVTNTQTVQDIEYRKTGVILTVTPEITEGGVVSMSIRQEVSDKSTDRTVGNASYPSFAKREVETSVVTMDGESIVIGGLIQERAEKTTTGVPVLSKIPFLGNLFKYTADTMAKTELVILLTPRVIWDIRHSSDITEEFENRLEGLKEMLQRQKKDVGPPPPPLPISPRENVGPPPPPPHIFPQ